MSSGFINDPRVLHPDVKAGPNLPQQDGAQKPGSNGPTTENTDVYFWYFGKDVSTESATPAYSQSMLSVHANPPGVESVVNTIDGRASVASADYSTATGKYRGIVKLFLLYDGQVTGDATPEEATWAIATGFLVSADVVVTAGHCAFDYSRGLGRLIQAKAYVGYGTNSVAFSYGAAVATTDGWINKSGSEPADLSFIKLKRAFTAQEVSTYYNMKATPLSGRGVNLGVVGYPGDIVGQNGERGASLYEMFRRTDYDLAAADRKMLQYQIDTYGGNSGSPVFDSEKAVDVIGVHVLGGYSYNSASVFNGNYGNRCHAYFLVAQALTDDQNNPPGSSHPAGKPDWLWKCTKETTESDTDPVGAELDTVMNSAKTVVKAPATSIVDWAQPLTFGTEAGPRLSILSSAAIATAGRLAADSVSGANVESLSCTRPYDGILGRSILAECALQHFLSLSPEDQKPYREKMGNKVTALKPLYTRVGPRILRGTLEPSMRLLLSTIAGPPDSGSVRATRESLDAEKDTGFGRALTADEEAFMKGLIDTADRDAVESFWSTLTTIGDVIGSAFRKAGPVIADVAKIGLPLLLGSGTGTEAAGGGRPLPPPPPSALDPLGHRALLAEACLQTYVECIQTESATRRKSIFSKILDKVKVFGPIMMRASPYVAKYIAPVVADVLREVNGQNKAEFLDFTYGK